MNRRIDSLHRQIIPAVVAASALFLVAYLGTGCGNNPPDPSEPSTSSAYTAPSPEGTGAATAPDDPCGDIAPMVFADNTLYVIDDRQDEWKLEEAGLGQSYIGTIISYVSDGSQPTEEFQANDDIVGAKVYRIDNGIAVFFKDECMVYRPCRSD